MAEGVKDFLGTGWAFPVELQGGKVRVVSAEVDVRQAIELILGTSFGERVMEPEFGCALQELVFSAQNTSNQQLASYYVRQALERWEPRIRVEDVRATSSVDKPEVLLISIDYVIRSRNQRHNLVYPFYVSPPR
ncbi:MULTISPECIES: GPW/gp25 family protein [Corallococcus]|uniref:Baseplate assembly protein n=1 Tax=Corallococcus llansteffanensis TaxID=2316731 RepID=A0A3A8N929_9BACT|nr:MULTISPECIES: GPW/gp25 family protein [Corallococcus]RKH00549.1 baseplate assembly protein [Corallococcus sp. CA053C]RKH40798.1 baseplate assembly protein [Corallococcus llansteffanensis]